MTGFGRTGTYFACNQLQQQPDFMCLSKGLSGGVLPLSLTTCTDEIYDAFLGDDITTAFLHAHSFTGNPVGCASAIASLELLEKDECWGSIERIHNWHLGFAKEIEGHKLVEGVRVKGTIFAFDIKVDSTGYTSGIKDMLYNHFISQGVLLRPLGNVIYVLPPYCITDGELDKVYKSIISGLEKIAI